MLLSFRSTSHTTLPYPPNPSESYPDKAPESRASSAAHTPGSARQNGSSCARPLSPGPRNSAASHKADNKKGPYGNSKSERTLSPSAFQSFP